MKYYLALLILNCFIVVKSQIFQPKNGMIESYLDCNTKLNRIQIQIQNDTIYGNFKLWKMYGNKYVLISEGFLDNRNHNYNELKYKDGEAYFESERKSHSLDIIYSTESKKHYAKTLNFIDTCRLVRYIYENSFKTYCIDYDSTGKIIQQEYNTIKKFKGRNCEIADSVVQYKKGVKYRIRYENILSGESLYIIDKEYYDYKKGKLFYAGYSLIDPKNDNTIRTDYYFHKNGRIKGVYTRYGLMYLSRIKDFDEQGKPMPFSDEDFISN